MHLYRISSIPTLHGSHIHQPICLTCSGRNIEQATETSIKLERNWYDENDDILDNDSVSMREFLNDQTEDSTVDQSNDCLYHSVIFPETSSAKYVL